MHEITQTGAAAALAFTGWFQVACYNFCVADAPQPGSIGSCPLIDNNDTRLLDAVFRNGKVWATHHVGATLTPTQLLSVVQRNEVSFVPPWRSACRWTGLFA